MSTPDEQEEQISFAVFPTITLEIGNDRIAFPEEAGAQIYAALGEVLKERGLLEAE